MLFYNEDWIHFIWTRYCEGIDVTEDVLRDYIYSFKDTQVTDFVMNVNGTVSTAPSKILETFMDKYLIKEENGVAVDYSNTYAKTAYDIFVTKNIDMYSVWIDTLKQIGINPWISIRMNDRHGNDNVPELRKSSYVDKCPQYQVSSYRSFAGEFDACFDYSHKEVRNVVLSYIDEMLGRYDVYGLELDMTREMIFFRPGFEAQGKLIMKNLIDDIYGILDKYGKKYGHKIKLSIMVPPEPADSIERGVDILSFADKIDNITIIGRWVTTCTDMPIELWKRLLSNTDIKLGGGQQVLISPYPKGGIPTITSVKAAFGQAIANLSRGCDYVYLYNYMDMAVHEGMGEWIYDDSIRNDANRPLIFNNIGEKETLLKQSRSHVITFNDFRAIPRNVHSVLPIYFNGNTPWYGYTLLKFPVGEIPNDKRARLILGINNDTLKDEDFKIFINSSKCALSEITELDPHIYSNSCYAFDIKENLFETMMVELIINKSCTVEYAEIEIL